MKILVDANIILSAFVFGSVQIARLLDAIVVHHECVVPVQVIEECFRVAERKSPGNSDRLVSFFEHSGIQVLPTPERFSPPAPLIRDFTDQSILRAAIDWEVDIVLSGDKDFLTLELPRPRIMTATQFRVEFMSENE